MPLGEKNYHTPYELQLEKMSLQRELLWFPISFSAPQVPSKKDLFPSKKDLL